MHKITIQVNMLHFLLDVFVQVCVYICCVYCIYISSTIIILMLSLKDFICGDSCSNLSTGHVGQIDTMRSDHHT